ncbi:MFS transporter [Sediminitomix flava]|uniref:Maltose/moltooligosaccharide transporter n=1 Tax=Sediminitomix flava TaxID=379075 RepID=A0A315ZHK3_SEDFL|nr:MFS transporter [Sediminitomix flava]PWJ44278.1 maltose/moltooligosaccharide transporter [Sediminitomix flava]
MEKQTTMKATKPKLSFWQIWNLSFGFLGVQFGFALQNANVSRILSTLGADPHDLPIFWMIAPAIGLVVQPVVGAMSDRTWNKHFGRRGPFIFGGAIAATIGMFLMPNASAFTAYIPAIWFGALMLALMDGSFNVTFQPFRALVADMLPEEQINKGYSVQTFLINVGAVVGSALPFILTGIGIQNTAPEGQVPDSVIWSFYIGGTTLLVTVLWTVFSTKEYPPKEYAMYNGVDEAEVAKEEKKGFLELLKEMPTVMWQLAAVQFFSWFALFMMWVFSTSAVAQHVWGTSVDDTSSAAYNEAANWVGILFAGYGVFAALFSLVMDKIANKYGRKFTYAIALFAGGIGYVSMYFITDQNMLMASMLGIGIAWAAILAMPYAILSENLPSGAMGAYMGIFNLTVVIPQLLSGVVGRFLIGLFDKQAIFMLVTAGVCMFIASALVFIVKDKKKA